MWSQQCSKKALLCFPVTTFSTSSLSPSLPWPYSPGQSPARDQGRLSEKVVVCSQNWAFDLTMKNAHFRSLVILTNTQTPEKYL